MEEINEHEIDGLIQTMKEMGIKGLMKFTDVLVLNHMILRKWIPPFEQRDELIKTLKDESDLDYNDIFSRDVVKLVKDSGHKGGFTLPVVVINDAHVIIGADIDEIMRSK